jgi:small subunit ribosomal protein S20
MANHVSAAKRAVISEKKRLVNKSKLTRTKTAVKKAETAIKGGDKAASLEALRVAESNLAKAAKTNIVNKKAASRKVSRLYARIKALFS